MNLPQSIQQLYSVFAKAEMPNKIIAFECASCLSKADEDYLLNTSVHELNDHIFGTIMESCNVVEMGNKIYKPFIPRMLELLAEETPNFSIAFVEYFYRDFAKFDYLNTFDNVEIKAINAFFSAYLNHELNKPDDERDEAIFFDVAETGFDVATFLKQSAHQKDWLKIKNNLLQHLDQERAWADSEQEFNKWTEKGSRKQLIEFVMDK